MGMAMWLSIDLCLWLFPLFWCRAFLVYGCLLLWFAFYVCLVCMCPGCSIFGEMPIMSLWLGVPFLCDIPVVIVGSCHPYLPVQWWAMIAFAGIPNWVLWADPLFDPSYCRILWWCACSNIDFLGGCHRGGMRDLASMILLNSIGCWFVPGLGMLCFWVVWCC